MKVLFAGETWFIHSVHQKGFDSFSTCEYGEGKKWLLEALVSSGIDVVHIANHLAPEIFPSTMNELSGYDVVILSDIGSNSLLFHPHTLKDSAEMPNRLKLLSEYVHEGGGLLMCGGWMSFQGIEGKANYHGSPIEAILPVNLYEHDDRAEIPEGFSPEFEDSGHPIIQGIPSKFPKFLFYNRLILKEGATCLARYQGDPVFAVWDCGAGRTAAFAMDIAPHGATKEFLEWKYFRPFWTQLIAWLSKGKR